MPARRRRRMRLYRLDRGDGRLCRQGAAGARRAADRMLDERQCGAAISRPRLCEALQFVPAYEADHPAEDPPGARNHDPRGHRRSGDFRARAPSRRTHAGLRLTRARELSMPMRLIIEPIVRAALLEDLGRAGDITTDALVPPDAAAEAAIV